MSRQTDYTAVLSLDGTLQYCSRLAWGQLEHTSQVSRLPQTWGELLDLARKCSIAQLWLHGDGISWNRQLRTIHDGWELSPLDLTHPAGEAPTSWWHTGSQPGQRPIDIAIPGWTTPGTADWDSLEHASARDLATALTIIEAGADARLWHGPGATGMKWIRQALHGAKLEKFSPPPCALGIAEEQIVWTRPLPVPLAPNQLLVAYDRNAMFLAACSSLRLGQTAPVYYQHGDLTYAPTLPGYWWCRVGDASPDWPATLPKPARVIGGVGWITTPTVEWLLELGYSVEIEQAWVWHDGARLLEPWYKQLRRARMYAESERDERGTRANQRAAGIALAAVKAIYTRSIGWFSSTAWDRSHDPLYRPDWRHHIIATANANLLRGISRFAQKGAEIYAVSTDCIYVLTTHNAVIAAEQYGIPLGDGLGHWKVKDIFNRAELAPHLAANGHLDLLGLQKWANRYRTEEAAV